MPSGEADLLYRRAASRSVACTTSSGTQGQPPKQGYNAQAAVNEQRTTAIPNEGAFRMMETDVCSRSATVR